MKNLTIILSFIIFSSTLQAQTLSYRLDSILNLKQPPATIAVNIFVNPSPDLKTLKKRFESEKTKTNQRPAQVIKYLQNHALITQSALLDRINSLSINYPGKIKQLNTYWISNSIRIEATPDIISQIITHKDAGYSDIDAAKIIFPEPEILAVSDHFPKTVQKGISVIHAPALWNLGYTGRGRKALGCDTGVNFTHPALRNRFYGTFAGVDHAWFAYENPWPVDISSSTHGTHTMGTILGLNQQDGDTIGVAFNAWWMATDPIVSNLSEVKPVSWILASFQWAMNPDGNINTSDDIPDVINNSWGLANSGDISHCNSPLNTIFEAVEAAGIGVVFSAGNEGPSAGTIGEPANISINDVNVFSVGSVLGHSALLPISGFSSRGPTNCITTDSTSLWFKPEVVAPGENVWSSIGLNSYGMLSGTSMASPHVSGAFLLLKEAFPELTGTEILQALYYSATDLGLPGEDNTYGRGIINVEAAYNYLSQTHTPYPPVQTGFDIAIARVEGIQQFTTGNIAYPVVYITNCGTNEITEFSITYGIEGDAAIEYTDTGNIQAGATKAVNLPPLDLHTGKNNLVFTAGLLIDVVENEILNNTYRIVTGTPVMASFPFTEDFENFTMPLYQGLWSVVNPDSSYTWLADTAGGNPNSTKAAIMPFFRYTLRQKQTDELISPVVHLPDTGTVIFTMKHAYQKKNSQLYKDSLQIWISTDYGQNFNHLIYSAGCNELATVTGSSFNTRFTPTLPSHWKTDTIDLSQFAGQDVMIKFTAKNDNGNQLYIDDISIDFKTATMINQNIENKPFAVVLYPNPVKNFLKISSTADISGSLMIFNCHGTCISMNEIKQTKEFAVDVSSIYPGIYSIEIITGSNTVTKRFIKQ